MKSPIISKKRKILKLVLSDSYVNEKKLYFSITKPFDKLFFWRVIIHGAAGGKVRVAHPLVSLGTATKIKIFSRVIYAIAPIPAPHSPVGPLSPTTMHKKTKPQDGALFFYGAAGGKGNSHCSNGPLSRRKVQTSFHSFSPTIRSDRWGLHLQPPLPLNKSPINGDLFNGAAGGNRTHDPILTKDVRYHYATAAKGSPL